MLMHDYIFGKLLNIIEQYNYLLIFINKSGINKFANLTLHAIYLKV